MEAPGIFTLLAVVYGIFLVAIAWAFDGMAKQTSNRTMANRAGTFRYLAEHDAWQCPEDQWLWPSSFDPENRVMRYRGNPTVCNTCPVKDSCTVSHHGREVTRQLDPWPHSDAGRFHRGIAFAVAAMGYLLPLCSLITNHSLSEVLIILATVLVISALGVYPLSRHLWRTPSNAPKIVVPELDNREAELAAQIDRYGSKYGKSKFASDRKKSGMEKETH
ncbi:hypothetical protein [Corynebacterium sp. HMSC04H06]|uniref:hypothetical protein n=1 Tax=Corynebacterium sp. HMSC04H06 TaxID=1581050 RepID=UPI0008A273AF|nr:hypothetical protein [Corynebacterium sp. HMSC04H06]OFS20202.1 hypothetical protein HMPREF3067_08120 [Corynebacterium sp. HMSC04H06]